LTDVCCKATYSLEAALAVQKESNLAEEIQHQETMRLAAEQEEKAEKERVEMMESAKWEIKGTEHTLNAIRQSLCEVQKDIVDNFEVGNHDNDDKIKDEDEVSESAFPNSPSNSKLNI
jgi:hypothetical protein